MNIALLDYWRQSIADTQRLSPPITGSNVHEIDGQWVKEGRIPENLAHKLIDAHRQEIQRKDKDFDVEKIKSAPISVTPFILLEKIEHTQVRKRGQTDEAAVIWLTGKVNEAGTLFADPDFYPWIDRASLEPVGTRSFVVGSVEAVDAYLEVNKLPEAPNWQQVYAYAENFWKEVTSQDLISPQFDKHALGKGRISLFSEQTAIGTSLIELCDKLRDYELDAQTTQNTALHSLLSQERAIPKAVSESQSIVDIKQHLGHIGEHTLASSQRQALSSILNSKAGEVVAVNGPPGTGKTTLVQSILASCVVKAALDGEKPFTMLACSTNNQAVTNLVDSLTEAAKSIEGDLLSDRWIPEVSSLGLYFASKDAQERNANGKYLFAGLREHSFPDEIENTEFVEKAKELFLEKAKTYFSDETLTFNDAHNRLHEQLKALSVAFEKSVDSIASLAPLQTQLATSSHASFELWLAELRNNMAKSKEKLISTQQDKAEAQRKIDQEAQQTRSLRRRVQTQTNAANLVELLLGFLPDIRQRKIHRAIDALETAGFHEDCASLHSRTTSLADVDKVCEKIVDRAIKTAVPQHLIDAVEEAQRTDEYLAQKVVEVENSQKSWSDNWFSLAGHLNCVIEKTATPKAVEFHPDQLEHEHKTNPLAMADLLDTLVRRRMFFLSLRYWESRWLLSAEHITPEDRKRQGQKYVQERFERYAMLTPCFVATFHKAAAAFRYFGKTPELPEKTSKVEERPMGGFFDILIVDEAGQVSPEIGAPCFYLAKRAAVVGDILQIPPVVKLNKFVDHGNLVKSGLSDQSDLLEEAGYISSTGNLMLMARNRTSITLADVPGLFLSEHRRCYDEVIAYCNLFYKGKLEPKRGSSNRYLPPIGYAHIDGTAERISGSWTNQGEARAIADWIERNKARLEKHYGKPISEIIAVVTPFRRQANLIINELENIKLAAKRGSVGAITVGTVHSLQGSERPIVLFSSVYDRTSNSGYFFDSEHSMLNVAVSRAKDSFLVFGDMHIFKPASRSHSGQLARFMFSKETNEISDVLTPQTLISKTNGDVTPITSLDEHRRQLSSAFKSAKERLLIYSPFLSINAIRADNVADLIQTARSNQVKITIVTCEENLISSGQRAREAVEELRKSGVEVTLLSRIHNKTLAVDNRLLIEGSFNWLSASRDDNYAQHERSFSYHGALVDQFINTAWDELKAATANKKKTSTKNSRDENQI